MKATKDYRFSQSTRKTAKHVFFGAVAATVYFYNGKIESAGLYPLLALGYDYVKHGTDLPDFRDLRRVLTRE